MALLRSYVGGDWVVPDGDGRPVFDAVTGEEIARVSSAGIDMAAALEYGRATGGPAQTARRARRGAHAAPRPAT